MKLRHSLGKALAIIIPIFVVILVSTVILNRNVHLRLNPIIGRNISPSAVERAQAQFKTTFSAGWINGIAVGRYAAIPKFTQVTSEHPQIVEIYTRLTRPFPTGEVRQLTYEHIVPLVQINPWGTSLAKIASGRYNTLLRQYAHQIYATKVPIALSFAHEANGKWYPWGCTHVTIETYRRAWRRVHDIIGTRNILWVWTIDHTWPTVSCTMMSRYPGSRYVDWIGVDGYLRTSQDTFNSVFGTTTKQLRKEGKPIILTEAGVSANRNQFRQMIALYTSAERAGIRGIIYFDGATYLGDYRPQRNSAVLQVFRQQIAASQRFQFPVHRINTGG